MNNGKWKTRKFVLTSAALACTFLALFLGKLSGGETVALVPLILGVFTGGNVVAKHNAFSEGV